MVHSETNKHKVENIMQTILLPPMASCTWSQHTFPLVIQLTFEGYCLRIIWVITLMFNYHWSITTFHVTYPIQYYPRLGIVHCSNALKSHKCVYPVVGEPPISLPECKYLLACSNPTSEELVLCWSSTPTPIQSLYLRVKVSFLQQLKSSTCKDRTLLSPGQVTELLQVCLLQLWQ